MTKNENSTRFYSNKQEKSVADFIGGVKTPNSGASRFSGGDVINKDLSLLVECKTATKDKDSFSIKKEWISKIREEAFETRFSNYCLAFNFGPNDKENYYVITEKLMKKLLNYLQEEVDS